MSAGQVVLVTGGTSGIGEGCVRLFLERGLHVAFTGRRTELGERLQRELEEKHGPRRCLYIQADHCDASSCAHSVSATVAHFGALHILVNNAGIVTRGRAEDVSEEEWMATINTNTTATWRMSKLALPAIRAAGGGAIVNNAGDAALAAVRNLAAYCASKGAVVALTKAMALDHAKENIRINCVCPGDTFVPRWIARDAHTVIQPGEQIDQSEIERRLRVSSTIPMGRAGDVMEVAKAIAFLAGSDSSFVTGVALAVDGGNTAQ